MSLRRLVAGTRPLRPKRPMPPPEQTIAHQLRVIDLLQKKELLLEKKIERETNQAKTYVRGKNKRLTLLCLRRIRNAEARISRLSRQRMSLEQQVELLQDLDLQKQVIVATENGVANLQQMTKEMGGTEKVDTIMDDAAEIIAQSTEISEALGQSMDAMNEDDDDEILEAFRALEVDTMAEDLVMETPTEPLGPPQKTKEAEAEEDFAALAAELAT